MWVAQNVRSAIRRQVRDKYFVKALNYITKTFPQNLSTVDVAFPNIDPGFDFLSLKRLYIPKAHSNHKTAQWRVEYHVCYSIRIHWRMAARFWTEQSLMCLFQGRSHIFHNAEAWRVFSRPHVDGGGTSTFHDCQRIGAALEFFDVAAEVYFRDGSTTPPQRDSVLSRNWRVAWICCLANEQHVKEATFQNEQAQIAQAAKATEKKKHWLNMTCSGLNFVFPET
jgi:hypothetical protein